MALIVASFAIDQLATVAWHCKLACVSMMALRQLQLAHVTTEDMALLQILRFSAVFGLLPSGQN